MPLFAALFSGIATSIFGLIASMVGAQIATRLVAVATVAALYVTFVGVFTAFIAPLIGSIFSTQYGQLLGLLFPPVAGTCVASLATLWAGILSYKYVSMFTRMAAG